MQVSVSVMRWWVSVQLVSSSWTRSRAPAPAPGHPAGSVSAAKSWPTMRKGRFCPPRRRMSPDYLANGPCVPKCAEASVRTVSSVNLEQAAWIAALVSMPIAALSAVVATFARRDAKQSARAAERSARAAEDLTEIEHRRSYEEMTPQLSVEGRLLGIR